MPENVENLQAIIYFEQVDYDLYEELFVSFQTDNNGWLKVLDDFSGQDVQQELEFPQGDYIGDPFSLAIYRHWNSSQKQLGIEIFDLDLINQIGEDAFYYANRSNFPEKTVRGHYLYLRILEELESKTKYDHHVLVFSDRGIVYICVRKRLEGFTIP